MRKNVKRIIIWILISLVAQVSVLFYAENFIFTDAASKAKFKKVEEKKEKIADIAINIPEDAKYVSMSYNGKYLSYLQDNVMTIITTMDGTKKTLECEGKEPYYKWLNDRNRMIIGEQKGGGNIALSYYDVSRDEKEKYNEISTGDSKAKLTDIEASTLTQVTYAKITFSQTRSSIYRIGINNDLTRMRLKTSRIGDYITLNREDILLYQDSINGTLYLNEGKTLSVKGQSGKSTILGIDSEDNIYIGYGNDEKVKTIYCGNIKENTASWKKYDLEELTSPKYINISKDGDVFVNDNLKGKIINLKNNNAVTYEGTFLDFYKNAAATINEGKLKHVELK
ncbi:MULTISPECIES: hypothetical protein [Clostridium]|uniref:Uncharacterized protein n=1 Tax=Clostridium cadaveris TaxID=1529 RepID=A0A316M148_9CLOT|nr:hypothetical protein [Clostridium cadaveris]MDU4951237.1 hypothetical protein [Clostridium sp.]MDY4947838.1 hypothetical protein [Clostridium cadaveris]NME63919.1 hypothetical protein [Clostridium cadaveris]PWL51904.1 MAG: hypothetical protein DBY38_13255 [Clostridium cadaveris]